MCSTVVRLFNVRKKKVERNTLYWIWSSTVGGGSVYGVSVSMWCILRVCVRGFVEAGKIIFDGMIFFALESGNLIRCCTCFTSIVWLNQYAVKVDEMLYG